MSGFFSAFNGWVNFPKSDVIMPTYFYGSLTLLRCIVCELELLSFTISSCMFLSVIVISTFLVCFHCMTI